MNAGHATNLPAPRGTDSRPPELTAVNPAPPVQGPSSPRAGRNPRGPQRAAAFLWLAVLLPAFLVFPFATVAAEPWTLEHALTYALAHNPDARLAQQRIAVAQAGIEQANSVFWPRVQLQSSYTRTDNPMMVFGSILAQRAYNYSAPPNFNHLPDVDDLNARGLVTVPLYAGGRMKAGREAAKAGSAAASQDAQAVRNALGFEVARGFFTVLKTREFIRAAEAAVRSYETNLNVAQQRVNSGSALKTDVLDLDVRLAQARENWLRARNANALATRAFRNLLGVDEAGFEVAESAPALTAPESGDFSRRAELAAARQRERAAQEQVRGAKSGRYPRLSAFGSLDYDYGAKFNHDGGSYTAGALLQWDLWDGHLTRAKVREAEANLESAREEQRKLRFALDLEVEQARLDLGAANERLNVTEKAIAQAAESASLTRARFGQGLALATQLIDAETALVAARVRRAEAEADQRVATAALRKALALPQMTDKQ